MTEEVVIDKGEKHEVPSQVDQIPTDQENGDSVKDESESSKISCHDFGFDLEHLYRLSLKFFKDNVDKAFHPSYDNRNKLVALSMQAKHGQYTTDKWEPGAFDFVGKDRKQMWSELGALSKDDAKKSYVTLLDEICSLYKPFMEAHEKEREDKEKKESDEIAKKKNEEEEEQRKRDEEAAAENARRKLEEDQRRSIQDALNRQTFAQFSSYAQQQYPSSPEEQGTLVRQLQEQHYQQYMQQLVQHQQQRAAYPVPGPGPPAAYQQPAGPPGSLGVNGDVHSPEVMPSSSVSHSENQNAFSLPVNGHLADVQVALNNGQELAPVEGSDEEAEGTFAPAQMWTRKEIDLFKEAITKEGGEGIIKVGHGEIVTWTKNPGNQVSVHVSESEDEDDDDDDISDSAGLPGPGDPERGTVAPPDAEETDRAILKEDGPPTSVIVPIYRRDSHEEVFAGSHPYPGRGVYLLKFDNSYSLWRSKTLYYRVYYTR
ncbi:Golgi resident protein GCP60 [Halotydeus destructor]|nr:Golgi resident protein GCP60 [Halotydeus destructor]